MFSFNGLLGLLWFIIVVYTLYLLITGKKVKIWTNWFGHYLLFLYL